MLTPLTKIETACANTILECFFQFNEYITHMKLQKIYYFTYGTLLTYYNKDITSHSFQAWPYGPVLPNLYRELKKNQDTRINELIEYQKEVFAYDKGDIFDVIKQTVNKLRYYNAWQLSEMTHAIEGPWFKVVKTKGYKQDIDPNLIKIYFKENPVL